MYLYMINWFMIIFCLLFEYFEEKILKRNFGLNFKLSRIQTIYQTQFEFEFQIYKHNLFKNGWSTYYFLIFHFKIVVIDVIYSILWIKIILYDSNSYWVELILKLSHKLINKTSINLLCVIVRDVFHQILTPMWHSNPLHMSKLTC